MKRREFLTSTAALAALFVAAPDQAIASLERGKTFFTPDSELRPVPRITGIAIYQDDEDWQMLLATVAMRVEDHPDCAPGHHWLHTFNVAMQMVEEFDLCRRAGFLACEYFQARIKHYGWVYDEPRFYCAPSAYRVTDISVEQLREAMRLVRNSHQVKI